MYQSMKDRLRLERVTGMSTASYNSKKSEGRYE